jgi:hypothetical protein
VTSCRKSNHEMRKENLFPRRVLLESESETQGESRPRLHTLDENSGTPALRRDDAKGTQAVKHTGKIALLAVGLLLLTLTLSWDNPKTVLAEPQSPNQIEYACPVNYVPIWQFLDAGTGLYRQPACVNQNGALYLQPDFMAGSGFSWPNLILSGTNTGTGMVLAPTATGTIPFKIAAPSGMTVDAFDVNVGTFSSIHVLSNGIVNINNTLLGTNNVGLSGNSLTNAAYLESNVAPSPSSGFLRMASTDSIAWRNNGNTADVLLAKNSSDALTYNGNVIATTSGPADQPDFAVDLTAQSANCTTQTLTTPSANGFYLLSGYLVITQAATTSSTTPAITENYTDADSGVAESIQIIGSYTGNILGNASTRAIFPIFAKAGVAITLSCSGYASSGTTAMQYALHARLQGPF